MKIGIGISITSLGVVRTSGGDTTDDLLMEDGSFLLLEDGSKILLE